MNVIPMGIAIATANGLIGAAGYDKKEKRAMETISEAWDMRNEAQQKLSEKQQQAVTASQILCKRKNATIQNLVGFKEDLQTIINLGLIIDDYELINIEEINIQQIQKFENYQVPPVSPKSNMAELLDAINPFTGMLAGSMIRDGERKVQWADYEWDLANQEKSIKLAEADIYEQISTLAKRQKDILSKLNQFFNHDRKYVSDVIEKNGTKKENYSSEERKKITLMVQCAKCMNAFLSVELMNEEYKITEQAQKLMDTTEQFMEKSMKLI